MLDLYARPHAALPANENAGVVPLLPLIRDDQPLSLDANLDVMRLAWHLKEGGLAPEARTERDRLISIAAHALLGVDKIDRGQMRVMGGERR